MLTLNRFPGVPRFVILLTFLLFSLSVFAGGQRENPLDKANKLVQEKKYNEAILYLTELVKKNPEYMDEAEKIMGKIREIRSQYNEKYAELIDVLFEKHDVAKALELIDQLRKLDPNPNRATIEAITKAKRGAEIVFNLNRFEGIMNKALSQLDEGKYLEAVNTYLSGYDLHREDFDKATYGDIVKNSVYSALSKLEGAAKNFIDTANRSNKQFDTISVLISGTDIKKLKITADGLIPNLKTIARDISILERAAKIFYEANKSIREKSENKQGDYFLHYAYLLTKGRSPEKGEGLQKALEMYFDNRIVAIEKRLKESAALNFAKGKKFYEENNYTDALSFFNIAGGFYDVFQRVIMVHEAEITLGGKFELGKEDWDIINTNLPSYLLASEKLKEIEAYRELISIALKTPVFNETVAKNLSLIREGRKKIEELQRGIVEIKKRWEFLADYYTRIGKLGFDTLVISADARSILARLDTIYSNLLKRDVRFVNAENFIEYESIATQLEKEKKKYEEGKRLKDGYDVIVETIKDNKGKEVNITRHERYPSKAITRLEPLKESLAKLEKEGSKLVSKVGKDPILASNPEEQRAWIKKTKELHDSIINLLEAIDTAIADANNLLLLAKRYENEGRLRMQEAESALKRSDFKRAKESVALSGKAFANSLSYEENKEIRRLMDKVLPELSTRIVKEENLFVVREVRKLINAGRRYFGLGEYAKAEETLLKAKARWEDTNTSENKEITNWLTIVRSALSVKSGREISEKDPLYTEMTQLLNFASEDYLEGARLLKEKKKVQALERFKAALDKIQRVKLAFPYNREARVLALKIQKLSDPENFSASLTRFFNEAIKNQKINPKESYADLKDIEEIEPNYPGLKKAIYNLEIYLGIRIPPPDPKKIAESERLYKQAYSIVLNNRIDLFPAALEELNRAIELNPNNEKAIALKDRIQIAAGGTVQTVLSSFAEEQYRLAENKYLAGKYLEALAIVEKLLQDKRNRNYPPLLELKKRIETKI